MVLTALKELKSVVQIDTAGCLERAVGQNEVDDRFSEDDIRGKIDSESVKRILNECVNLKTWVMGDEVQRCCEPLEREIETEYVHVNPVVWGIYF